jgi:CBS domain-containing protein
MGNPFLLFIAIFVYLGAQAEAQQTELRMALEGVPVEEAMMTRFRTLTPHDTVGDAIDELLAGAQVDFPVVMHDDLVGMLVRRDLVEAATGRGRATPVGDVMRKDFHTVTATGDMQAALTRMQADGGATLPVLGGEGRLVGLLTRENLGEYLMLHAAMHGVGGRSRMTAPL